MSQQLKVGDTVRLKSGGPMMTVNELIPKGKSMEGKYLCQWFTSSTLKQGYFPVNSIKKVEPLPDLEI